MMEPLDGNAIAGQLHEHFGNDMTTATGACGHCGRQGLIGELRVYLRAPGAVVRCQHCGKVVFVLVTIRERVQVRFDSYQLLDSG
jgi:hypothetical protein